MIESKSVDVTEEHILAISQTMQKTDVAHAWHIGHLSPEQSIRHSVRSSIKSNTWLIDTVPVVIYGISKRTLLSRWACPWLLGSDRLKNYAFILLRQSKHWVEREVQEHGALRTCVEKGSDGPLRWLKWLGFNIRPPIPLGIEQRLFHTVELRK